MIWIEKVICIHGIELDDESQPGRDCEQCADALQLTEACEFLRLIGMVGE